MKPEMIDLEYKTTALTKESEQLLHKALFTVCLEKFNKKNAKYESLLFEQIYCLDKNLHTKN